MKSRKSRLVAPDSEHRTPASTSPYRGRFAPSPTGPLHIGSVVAALASYLDARSNDGAWLVRIEDLDPPRESAGASADILRTLEALGLFWDESVVYQSQRSDAYDAALEVLASQQLLYHCRCSRSELLGQANYPGTCRELALSAAKPSALRCRAPSIEVTFKDRLQGRYGQHLANDVGDFVIRRKDGYYAYQLAVVVDDGWQQITDVVRGIDLIDSTPRQLYLQDCLQLPHPHYAHIPIVVNTLGQKLSKQQLAPSIHGTAPASVLVNALRYLEQPPPCTLIQEPVSTILQWAVQHWQPQRLENLTTRPE
jgi:glutamyl-Q tRNA(Asp) synthetase